MIIIFQFLGGAQVPNGLLPLHCLALHAPLCTAFRLLEDYGRLCPGDCVIQNAADDVTGVAVRPPLPPLPCRPGRAALAVPSREGGV